MIHLVVVYIFFVSALISECNILYTGNVYIADQGSHRIRKVVVSTGIIITIAGSAGTISLSGDGGQATSATLSGPMGVALDSSGL